MRRDAELGFAALLVCAYVGPLRRGFRNLQDIGELSYQVHSIVLPFFSYFKGRNGPHF